jgi:hypothetical protein
MVHMPHDKMPSSFIAMLVAAAVSAFAQDPAAIQKKLVSEYALTQPTADLSEIVTAGAVLVLQKSNLMMAPVSGTNFYQNTYRDGKISQNTAGKVTNALSRFSRLPGASAPAAPATRTYVTGEKMWVTKIDVKTDGKENEVNFDLYTDAVADVRYKAALKIVFPKGATEDQVDKIVAEVFRVQPAEQQQQAPAGVQQAPPAAAPAAAQAAVPPVAPPPPPADNAPVPDIPPPPPPADAPAAPPQTISLGQTTAEVIAIFGQPQKIVNLGAKQTYYYKDLKVIFTGGKVSDVQ